MLTEAQIKRRIKILLAGIKRIGLQKQDFSIISNNCWGGMVYDEFHLPYLTPTVGMWIPSGDYLKFISNLQYYLAIDVEEISYKECHASELLEKRKREGRYSFDLDDLVIGRIDDVDIVFLHYHTFEDAKRKWEKRRTRVNFDNLIVKYNDQNGFDKSYYHEFCKLSYPKKLFFTVDPGLIDHDWCFLFQSKDDDGNVDDTVIGKQPFSIKSLLNSMAN